MPTQNQKYSEPSLKDLLDFFARDIMLNFNCHAIATIQSFDPGKQSVSATVNYTKTKMVRQTNGTYTPQEINYPILLDCPAIMLGGGSFALTFPVQAGDQALILFNDRDLDNWVAGARSGPVNTPRLHSLSDGIAIVGLNKVPSIDSSHALLVNGDTKVGISDTKVLIANSTGTLDTVLEGLCDVIAAALNGIVPGSGAPVTAYKLVIGALLE